MSPCRNLEFPEAVSLPPVGCVALSSPTLCRPPDRVSVMVKSDRPWEGGSSQGCQHVSVSSPKPQDGGEVVGDPHPPLGEPLADRRHANRWPQAQRCSPSGLRFDFPASVAPWVLSNGAQGAEDVPTRVQYSPWPQEGSMRPCNAQLLGK